MKRIYTPAHIDFLGKIIIGRTCKEVTRLFNDRFGMSATDKAIKCLLAKHGLRNGHCPGIPRYNQRKYQAKHLEYLKQIVPGTPYKIVLEKFNKKFGFSITVMALRTLCKKHHIQNGFLGYFSKGNIPFNKGRKGYCAPGSEKGWFKPGAIPPNTMPIGSERISKDGYVEVKFSNRSGPPNNRWKSKHALIWEKKNGPVPKGHVVIFADGNKENIKLSNLILVSRKELSVLNHMNLLSKNKETNKTAVNIARIKVLTAGIKRGTWKSTRKKKVAAIDRNGNRIFVAFDEKTKRYISVRDSKHGARQLQAVSLKPRKTADEARKDLSEYALKRGWLRA